MKDVYVLRNVFGGYISLSEQDVDSYFDQGFEAASIIIEDEYGQRKVWVLDYDFITPTITIMEYLEYINSVTGISVPTIEEIDTE